jgi:hypothetical protein
MSLMKLTTDVLMLRSVAQRSTSDAQQLFVYIYLPYASS